MRYYISDWKENDSVARIQNYWTGEDWSSNESDAAMYDRREDAESVAQKRGGAVWEI